MKLLVLGATGATGQLVVQQALDLGHDVTALVRSAEKLTDLHSVSGLRIETGQVTDVSDIARAMYGADAVISTLGAPKGTLITDSARAIITAAETQQTRRIVVLSSFAVARDQLTTPAKVMAGLAMANMVRDKSAGEKLLHGSGLDWTVAHAARLTDGPATSGAQVLPSQAKIGLSQSISRADVAAWLITTAASNDYLRQSVTITS